MESVDGFCPSRADSEELVGFDRAVMRLGEAELSEIADGVRSLAILAGRFILVMLGSSQWSSGGLYDITEVFSTVRL
jgi:hypothetical protein